MVSNVDRVCGFNYYSTLDLAVITASIDPEVDLYEGDPEVDLYGWDFRQP